MINLIILMCVTSCNSEAVNVQYDTFKDCKAAGQKVLIRTNEDLKAMGVSTIKVSYKCVKQHREGV